MTVGLAQTNGEILYFAYGSNMLTARLRARVPSCKPIGIALLPDHELRFHKRTKDGSGKCDAFHIEGGGGIYGVVFSFNASDRQALDRFEGLGAGYNDAIVTVHNVEGRSWKVLTYTAHPHHIDEMLKPYSWYRDLVLAGASEHGLPQQYVATRVEAVEAIEDLNFARDATERAALER